MYDDTTSRPPSAVALQVERGDLAHLRLMLREQIAGDAEMLRDLAAGVDSRHEPGDVARRLDFLWNLANQVGGAYGDELPEAA